MQNKFDKIFNEYIVGTQNTIPTTTFTVPSNIPAFAGGRSKKSPPDTGTGMGHTKTLTRALNRDKIRKNKNEKQLRKINKSI